MVPSSSVPDLGTDALLSQPEDFDDRDNRNHMADWCATAAASFSPAATGPLEDIHPGHVIHLPGIRPFQRPFCTWRGGIPAFTGRLRYNAASRKLYFLSL